MHTAQLFIDNDLFKVMEIKEIKPEIRIPLPVARIDWFEGELREEKLPVMTITHLNFDLEAVVQDGSHEVFRYRFRGGS